jgi:L-ascorbate metabolism protein UlaG (beta-lactamase superfamily)
MNCLSLVRAAVVALIGTAATAVAQQPVQPAPPAAPQAKPEMMENCPGLVAGRRPRVIPAAFKPVALDADQVRITYVGHSTFLIESPKLVRIATDYNDWVKPSMLPDIVTMNHAHSTHYTDRPEPGIKHVLRGWRDDGKPAGHDVSFQDVRVRSVATNIRTWGGETERHGNSIFIFEIAQMCIAHLGHLHHTLNQQQLNEIGRIDIVLFPVDGSATLDLEGMADVLTSLKAKLMIPMHYFSSFTLNRMMSLMQEKVPVEFSATPSMLVSKTTLPAAPKIVVLPGR